MNPKQAVDIIYTGLVSENSVPVKLAAFRELDSELLDRVMEALELFVT